MNKGNLEWIFLSYQVLLGLKMCRGLKLHFKNGQFFYNIAVMNFCENGVTSQFLGQQSRQVFACSKSRIETLEKRAKYVQCYQ